jgi:hypothetical protein
MPFDAGDSAAQDVAQATETGAGGSGNDATTVEAGGNSGTAVTIETAVARYADAICGHVNECWPWYTSSNYADVAQCKEWSRALSGRKTSAPGSKIDPSRFALCAAAIANAPCDTFFAMALPEACRTQHGTLPDGAGCVVSEQCESGYCLTTSSPCGVCARASVAGGQCMSTGCDFGLVCAGGTCVVPGAPGAACSASAPCVYGLICDNGVCRTALAPNAACDPTTGTKCFGGYFCDATARTCKPDPLVGAGASCTSANCGGGTICSAPSAGSVCLTEVLIGAACGGPGIQCRNPSKCLNGTCQFPDPAACP